MLGNKQHVRHVRIGIVGAQKSGKTVLVNGLLGKEYNNYESTIGIDYHYSFLGNDGKIPVLLWDCSGNYRYHELVKDHYYPKMDILVIICNTIASKLSFDNDYGWIKSQKKPIIVITKRSNVVKDDYLVEKMAHYCKTYGYLLVPINNTSESIELIKKHIIGIVQKLTCPV